MARSLMVGLALFGMLLAVQEADAGRRRGGCSGGSCGVTYSGCANGSCSVAAPVYAAAPAKGPVVAVETPRASVNVEVAAQPQYRATQVSARGFRGRLFSRR
jgi:hypothetical protein